MAFPGKDLLRWYRKHKRAMPWRDEVSPYRTWLSEIMLQQTQVETVRGYFLRFIERFPDEHALAAADEQAVLSLWAGLGYYSRARNLHKAARLAVERHGGLPARKEDWAELPGVGPYTLGAVRSIAYGEPEALVDGNVVRVLARVAGKKIRRGDPKGEAQIWDVAREILDRDAPGDFNQALMELGAVVCTPESPRCMLCPLRAACVAYASGEPAKYPLPKLPPKRKSVRLFAAWIEREGRVLLVERPRPGLWAGMWAFPSAEADLPAALSLLGAKEPREGEQIVRVSRTLTHRDVDLSLHRYEAKGRLVGRWVEVSALADAGMPSAFKALLAAR